MFTSALYTTHNDYMPLNLPLSDVFFIFFVYLKSFLKDKMTSCLIMYFGYPNLWAAPLTYAFWHFKIAVLSPLFLILRFYFLGSLIHVSNVFYIFIILDQTSQLCSKASFIELIETMLKFIFFSKGLNEGWRQSFKMATLIVIVVLNCDTDRLSRRWY